MTNLLILSSHAILEYDDLRLFSDLGFDTFIPGAYSDPLNPGAEFGTEPFRPGVPNAIPHPELEALCHEQRVRHQDESQVIPLIIDWAKADLHPDLVDWADVIMVNCFPQTWIGGQWDAIRHKRVIWRTIGQSSPHLEVEMRDLARQGMEIVRYSPAEKRAFEPLGVFAGEDAVIRFSKYPSDFKPWVGDRIVVGNVTQNLTERGDHCGLDFWEKATAWLPTLPAGLGSQRLPNGLGTLSYPDLIDYLSHLRTYLFMGTQPASYTLAMMEAMLAGVPMVSIGPSGMWMPELFEGHELAGVSADDPYEATKLLQDLLHNHEKARILGEFQRGRAIARFGNEAVGKQWLDFLGSPVKVAEAVA